MRLLCLYFPRLSVSLARREGPLLAGRPVVLASGAGDHALVAGASVEAAMMGIAIGMSAEAARNRCPAAAVLPDNGTASLEALDQVAAILRARATPNVAIVSREHIILDLSGLESRFLDEATAAARLASLVREWSGLEVRAGVADTADEARKAAHCARRLPRVAKSTGAMAQPVGTYDAARAISGRIVFPVPPDARTARAQLLKLINRLQLLLEGRNESARRLRLTLDRGSRAETLVLDATAPMHTSADVLQLLAGYTSDAIFARVSGLAAAFEKLGPAVRVERQPLPAGHSAPTVMAPVRPVQHRLLRAV